MQLIVYEYLDRFDLAFLPEDLLLILGTQVQTNRCYFSILCEIVAKSLVVNRPFKGWQLFLDKAFGNNTLNRQEGWGLVFCIIALELQKSQGLMWLYFNLTDPLKFSFVLSQIIQCFQDELQVTLGTSLITILKQFKVRPSEIDHLDIYTFQASTSSLASQVNDYFDEERLVLDNVKRFYATHSLGVCNMFLGFLGETQNRSLLAYFRTWIKAQLTNNFTGCRTLTNVLELFCKAILNYEDKFKDKLIKTSQVFEIPQLYNLYSQIIRKQEQTSFPYFEQFMFKHSLVKYLVPLLMSNPDLQRDSIPVQQSLSKGNYCITGNILDHPHKNWKTVLQHYLSISGIKLNKQTHDPLAFMMIKKSYWERDPHRNTLSLCLWLSLLEWKEMAPQKTPQLDKYFGEMNKVIIYFLLTLPMNDMVLYFPNQLTYQQISAVASEKPFGALCARCPYIMEVPWLHRLAQYLPQITVSSEQGSLFSLEMSQKLKSRVIPEIANRILHSVQMSLRKSKPPFNRPHCNFVPLRSLVSYFGQFKELQSHSKFILSMF